MPLNLFYTMVQKSQKWPKTHIKGGPALSLRGVKSWKTTTTTRAPNPWKRRKIKCVKQQKTTSTSMWQDVNTYAMPTIPYIYINYAYV